MTSWKHCKCLVSDSHQWRVLTKCLLSSRFLTLGVTDFWSCQFCVVRAVLGIVGHLAASLASTYHPFLVTTKNVLKHCPMSPGRFCPQFENHYDTHAPNNNIWVNDRLHMGQWSREIIRKLKHSYQLVTWLSWLYGAKHSSDVCGDVGVNKPMSYKSTAHIITYSA